MSLWAHSHSVERRDFQTAQLSWQGATGGTRGRFQIPPKEPPKSALAPGAIDLIMFWDFVLGWTQTRMTFSRTRANTKDRKGSSHKQALLQNNLPLWNTPKIRWKYKMQGCAITIHLPVYRPSDIVWFQKISIPPPPPTEDHWKFWGGGGVQRQ